MDYLRIINFLTKRFWSAQFVSLQTTKMCLYHKNALNDNFFFYFTEYIHTTFVYFGNCFDSTKINKIWKKKKKRLILPSRSWKNQWKIAIKAIHYPCYVKDRYSKWYLYDFFSTVKFLSTIINVFAQFDAQHNFKKRQITITTITTTQPNRAIENKNYHFNRNRSCS